MPSAVNLARFWSTESPDIEICRPTVTATTWPSVWEEAQSRRPIADAMHPSTEASFPHLTPAPKRCNARVNADLDDSLMQESVEFFGVPPWLIYYF